MRVVIEDEVFATPSNTLALTQLLHFAVIGRHTILTRPDFQRETDSAANRWLARQSQELREEFLYGLEVSLQNEVKDFERDIAINIAPAPLECAVDKTPPTTLCLPLAAANILLSRPLRLMVENDRNDRAFILMMLPATWRQLFERYEANQWVEFSSGGGLGELKKSLGLLVDQPAYERSRRVAIFDSDAREPKKPSRTSEDVRAQCKDLDVACHQLARRAAENYLPLPALLAWSERRPANTAPRRCLQGYLSLNVEQRQHFNMRKGLRQDAKSGESSLYRDLPEEHRANLHEGFGDDVRSLFAHKDIKIIDAWLDDEDLQDERNTITKAIFRRL